MHNFAYSSYLDSSRTPWQRRAPAFTFVLAVHVLLVLMLILAAPRPDVFFAPSAPLVVDLISAEQKADSSPRQAAKQEKKSKAAPKAVERDREILRPEVPASPPLPEMPPIELLQLTKQELASVGTTMGSRRAAGSAASANAGTEAAEGGGAGRGEGPGGAQLHDVDWYRKPTRAELTPYLPASPKQSGWGMVACKMVEGYRVEDCRELDQSPRGSGFSRAVRQAAWQFRVLPPRINGKPILGEWVRIRIDYTQGVPQ